MTAKDDPARVALLEVNREPLSDVLITILALLRHVYLHAPRALDSRNVSGMLGKALNILETVKKEMEIPVRRDD